MTGSLFFKVEKKSGGTLLRLQSRACFADYLLNSNFYQTSKDRQNHELTLYHFPQKYKRNSSDKTITIEPFENISISGLNIELCLEFLEDFKGVYFDYDYRVITDKIHIIADNICQQSFPVSDVDYSCIEIKINLGQKPQERNLLFFLRSLKGNNENIFINYFKIKEILGDKFDKWDYFMLAHFIDQINDTFSASEYAFFNRGVIGSGYIPYKSGEDFWNISNNHSGYVDELYRNIYKKRPISNRIINRYYFIGNLIRISTIYPDIEITKREVEIVLKGLLAYKADFNQENYLKLLKNYKNEN